MVETGVVPRLREFYRATLVCVANCKIAVPVYDLALITQQAAEEREKGGIVVTLVALSTLEQDLPSRRQSSVAPRGSRHKDARLQPGEDRDASETATSKCLLA
jgi:hypothetical protein